LSLTRQAAKAGIWFAGFRFVGQVFSWMITLAVARVLTPDDYGLMSIASILTGYVAMFSELGLGAAIVQREEISQEEYSSNFWFSVLLGVLFSVASFFLAYPTAWIFKEPRAIPITQLISVLFLIGSTMIVPFNILTRELRFKTIGMIQLVVVVVSSASMLWMAYHGFKVWTLILGTIIQSLLVVILVFIFTEWRPRFHFKFHEVRPFLRFGMQFTGARSLFYVFQKSDVFVVGKVLGTDALGLYSFAMELSRLPADKVVSIFTQVTFPLFSRFQKDLERIQDLYLRTTRYIALFLSPVFLGGAFFGDEIIRAVLGDKWVPISFLFRVLCFSQFVVSLSYTNAVVHNAMGRAKWPFYYQLVSVCLMPTSIYFAARHSFNSIAIPWLAVYPCICLGWTWLTLRKVGLSLATYARSLAPPVLGSLVMITLVKAVMTFLNRAHLSTANLRVVVVEEILIGATIYIGYLLWFERGTLKELWSIRNA
jgi:O-antigen/teichoic acid export membrane protein